MKSYKWLLPIILLGIWILIYFNLQFLTNWLIDDVFKLAQGKHLTDALRFFIFEVPKVLLLLVLIIFVAGIIRSFFTPERTRKALEGRSLFTGAEVLYFKANLACCKAKACNSLETEVKTIVEKNRTDGKVVFRQVKLSDTVNNGLIKKYDAKSQTLVIGTTKKKKETSTDISALLQDFGTKHDTASFERDLTAKIREVIK